MLNLKNRLLMVPSQTTPTAWATKDKKNLVGVGLPGSLKLYLVDDVLFHAFIRAALT